MIDDADLAATILSISLSKKASQSQIRDTLLFNPIQSSYDLISALCIEKNEIEVFLNDAKRTINTGQKNGIHPIIIFSEKYPRSLITISDAPLIIYVRGNIELLKAKPGIAVVGTRKASPHGITIAERISEYIGSCGISVVSGLALGIDAAAHEGALRVYAPTIAVLAHGLEKASPRANAQLADRILEQNGLWVSEHAYGTTARPEYFVQRNRIQVGLSSASVIVEGEEQSGSMTQAEYCLRNRRILAAVLPSNDGVTHTHARLPMLLVKSRGAFPISNKADYPRVVELATERAKELVELGTF